MSRICHHHGCSQGIADMTRPDPVSRAHGPGLRREADELRQTGHVTRVNIGDYQRLDT